VLLLRASVHLRGCVMPTMTMMPEEWRTPEAEALLAEVIEYRRRHCVPHRVAGHPEPAPVPAPAVKQQRRPTPDPLPEPRKRGAHRKPRRKLGWKLASYTLAVSAGL